MKDIKITNKAEAEVEFCGMKYALESNTTEATPIKLKLEKTQNCNKVFVGHNIKFTIKIINDCPTDIPYVLFKDCLDENTTYVAGSFTYNGDPRTPEIDDNTLKFLIDKIKGKETAIITFEVKVNEGCFNEEESKEPDDDKEPYKDKEPELEKSAAPTIKTITKDDSGVSGTGIKGATVYVKFPNNEVVTALVSYSSWTAQTPSKLSLRKDDIVSAYQVEPGKADSDIISQTVTSRY